MSKQSNRTLSILTSSAVVFIATVLVAIPSSHPSSSPPKPPLVVVEALLTSSIRTSPTSLRQSILVSSNSILTTKLSAENNRPSAAGSNPFRNLFGDIASSLTGQQTSSSSTTTAALDSKISSMISYSWEEIRLDLESKQTPDERAFRSNVEKGIGPPSPLNKIRLYDESNKEEDIRVTFYR